MPYLLAWVDRGMLPNRSLLKVGILEQARPPGRALPVATMAAWSASDIPAGART
jgi:hypothetical protein